MSFRAYRVFLDANIWFKYLVAQQRGLSGTTVQRIVGLIQPQSAGTLQLIISHELLDTLGRVLTKESVPDGLITPFLDSLVGLSLAGPERQQPIIALGGRNELAMRDREPVIAAARLIAAGTIDRVVWVVPRDSLRLQAEEAFADPGWREALGHRLSVRAADNEPDPSCGLAGYITTYQGIAAASELHLARCAATAPC